MFASLVSKLELGAAILGIIGLLGWSALHYRDQTRVLTEQVAAQAAQLATAPADAAANEAALTQAAAAADARAQAAVVTHRKIADAPHTTACSASPAVGAALDSLRRPAPAAGAPRDPGGAAHVP